MSVRLVVDSDAENHRVLTDLVADHYENRFQSLVEEWKTL